MGKTIIEQTLASGAGTSVRMYPDYFVINDGAGYEVINLLDGDKTLINKERIVVILDHDIPAGSTDSAERQKNLIRFARKHDLEFIQSRGVGYQILMDRMVKRGQIIVSCGSHNSIFGAAGALGIGVSPAEMANVIRTGILEINVPETVKITLSKTMPKDVLTKDLILKLLADFGADGLKGKAVEFIGSGAENLSYDSKAALCCMIGQTGAAAAFFNTKESDSYVEDYTYNLDELPAMVAQPGNLYGAKPMETLKGTPIHAGFVGGCSGGRIEDLRAVAEIIEGRHVKFGLRFTVTPISNAVYSQAIEEGIVEKLVAFGAQIINPGCGSCQTQSSGVIGDGENLLSTGCYNYAGCAGTEGSNVYLASARLVARAAINGIIA